MEDGAILGKTPSIGKAIYPGVLANPNVTWEKLILRMWLLMVTSGTVCWDLLWNISSRTVKIF